jgi:multidrug efflux pump
MPPMDAALASAREVGFTVLSMSLSLIAVFIPILFMGDLVGRFFREFAVTLSFAILISLVVSLTLTPMMCAYLLRQQRGGPRLLRKRRLFKLLRGGYAKSLGWALAHPLIVILMLAATVGLNVYLYITIPKGFFPQQDVGRMMGFLRADQTTSFQAMQDKMAQVVDVVRADPAVSARATPASCSSRSSRSRSATACRPSSRACDRRPRRSPASTPSSCRCRTCGSAGGREPAPTSSPCRATTSRRCACGAYACRTRS